MSDDEDTAILLSGSNEVTVSKKEITMKVLSDECSGSPQQSMQRLRVVWISALVTFIAGFIFGYDMAIIVSFLKIYAELYQIECSYQVLLLFVWVAGGIFSLGAASIIDMCGRRLSMLLSGIIILIGTLLVGVSPWVAFIYMGRLFLGFGCTLSAISHCVYMAEISEPCWRGCCVSLHQLGISLGVLISLYTGYLCKNTEFAWRIVICANIFLLILNLSLTKLFLPSFTPVRKCTSRFWRKLPKITQITIAESSIVLMGLIAMQQLSGRFSVLMYAPSLFMKLGIPVQDAAHFASLTISSVRLFCTTISVLIVEKLGRRHTLIMSLVIMMLSIGALAVLSPNGDSGFNLLTNENCPKIIMADSSGIFAVSYDTNMALSSNQDVVAIDQSPPPFPLLPTPVSLVASEELNVDFTTEETINVAAVIALLVYEGAHALGPFTIIWLLGSEIFPTAFRGRCLSEAISAMWIIDIVCSIYSFTYYDFEVTYISFVFCTFICAILAILTFLFVPETKGKSLDQIFFELHDTTVITRMYINLSKLPILNRWLWLHQRASRRRNVLRPQMPRTVI